MTTDHDGFDHRSAPRAWPVYPDDPATGEPDHSRTERVVRATSRRLRTPLAVAALAVAGTAAAGLLPGLLLGSSDDAGRDSPQAGRPQTADGYAAMVADLEAQTGSTMAFEAVIYPGHAVVNVPYADDERSVGYRWDGELDEWSKKTSDRRPFDLTDVAAHLLPDLCTPALSMLEEPDQCYLVIRRPEAGVDDATWVTAYAADEFGRSARVEFGRGGNELERHPPGE